MTKMIKEDHSSIAGYPGSTFNIQNGDLSDPESEETAVVKRLWFKKNTYTYEPSGGVVFSKQVIQVWF